MSVKAVCSGDDDVFWFKAVIDGREVGRSVPVSSIESFQAIELRMDETLTAVYEKGQIDGARAARLAMRTAIGF